MISNKKLELSPKLEANAQAGTELQRRSEVSTSQKKREPASSEQLQELSRHSFTQLVYRADGLEGDPSRLSYKGYIRQREERRARHCTSWLAGSGSRLVEASPLSRQDGELSVGAIATGPRRPDRTKAKADKHQRESMRQHLDNLRRLQEMKSKRNRRVASDVQKFFTSSTAAPGQPSV